jgi:hypothetical protein
MQFIAWLEFELDYLGSTHKRASFEIFKFDSTWLDYIPKWNIYILLKDVIKNDVNILITRHLG